MLMLDASWNCAGIDIVIVDARVWFISGDPVMLESRVSGLARGMLMLDASASFSISVACLWLPPYTSLKPRNVDN